MIAQELRIGNYIDCECTTHIVTEISRTLVRSYWLKAKEDEIKNDYIFEIESCKPILITEEWLLKFGFEKFKPILGSYVKTPSATKKGYGFRFHTQNPFSDDIFCLVTETYYMEQLIQTKYWVKYVHQLQNLYFALTGEELKINV